MKLTVLIDNNTYIDEYYIGEPALSYYIEDENELKQHSGNYFTVLKGFVKRLEDICNFTTSAR